MNTKLSKLDECTLVEVSGFLDFETARPFANSIQELYEVNQDAQIVIDLSELEFVGSSGISGFVKGLRVFNRLNTKPTYCGLKSEFKRLFRLFEENSSFELCDSRKSALTLVQKRFAHWQMSQTANNN